MPTRRSPASRLSRTNPGTPSVTPKEPSRPAIFVSPPRTSKLMASTDRYAWLMVAPSSNRYEPWYNTVAIEGRKNGSSGIPVTTATANEYPAIRPNAAAHRSSGSRRSAPRTSRRAVGR